jgi:hypothetical protein
MITKKVEVVKPKWDRCARTGIIKIGENKVVLDITFAPTVTTSDEMTMLMKGMAIEPLDHAHACVIRLHDASDTIKPVKRRSKAAALDGSDFTAKNRYSNAFLDFATIIIEPGTDSMKYEGRMKEFATSPDVPFELRKFANRMMTYRVRKKKGSAAPDGKSLEIRIKLEYDEFWDWLMLSENRAKLQGIISETIESEFGLGSDFGLGPVPVIDSEKMLNYTKDVNRLTLAIWPKGQNDNCATYLILAPEVFSNPDLMKKIVAYIREVGTKFIVIKFKNLQLDLRNKGDECKEMQNLLLAINEIKHEHNDDRVFVALEAGFQMYPFAAGGFDIVSTSMTGYDGEFPFHRGGGRDISGYFDITWLAPRDAKYARKMLSFGGFPHEGCICSRVRDVEAALLDWPKIRREHYIRRVDELYGQIWSFIDEQKIELAKGRVSNSRVSNLKHILPDLDFL